MTCPRPWTLLLLPLLCASGCPGPLNLPRDSGGGDRAWPTIEDGQPTPPDTFTPPADAQLGGLGEPCPCLPEFICAGGVCRLRCSRTGICSADGPECTAAESCAATTGDVGACIPAVAPGAACSFTEYCPKGYACGAVDDAPHRCLPTCPTVDAPCGSGGTCRASGKPGCSFCSVP